MDKSSTYCVMPHLGMALQNESDFCCCNANKSSWQDNKRNVMYVHSHDMKSSYNSHTRKIIAASLDNGRQHPSCQACWDAESTNNQSKRQEFNKLFGEVTPLSDQPRVLIIKPGNTCNFACRMCNPVTSSSWYHDGHELEKENLTSSSWYATDRPSDYAASLTYNEYTRTFETIRNSFNQDNTEFWNTLKQWIKNLVYIDIYGGEPFLIPAMFDLLEYGVNIGVSKQITIHIHTNASIFNQQYLEILAQYKQVSFKVSIDSADPAQLEYIRHKSNYDTVIENSKKFNEITKKYTNINMAITNTITPLNVFYIDKINKELMEIFGLPIVVNIVTTPEYDIRHLPVSVKQYLIDNLSSSIVVNFLKQTIPGCDVEWPKFCQSTDKLDQLRGQSFAKTFPDWWNMLKPFWVKTI
jgi:MoaA/NifB/PqqE/SkfB family radical SAM enzyme